MKHDKSRRSFIEWGLTTSLALPFLGSSLFSCTTKPQAPNSTKSQSAKQLKILILGGTSFLGPHQIAYALQQGHSITIFTRGKTKPSVHQNLFDQVEHLVGDRENNLTALENREWDAVIDNSGRKTEWTKKTAELLKDKVDIYLYTSSTGVYFPFRKHGLKETDEVLVALPKEVKDEQLKSEYAYGIMKASSEAIAQKTFGKDRTIVVRPTYMIGPADKSNRFIHWPLRLSKGGTVLVPGRADDPVQYIDVRDVAQWMIRLIENKKSGIFNAVGPKNPQTIYSFIAEAKKVFDVPTTLVKVDDYDFLTKRSIYGLIPWLMLDENYVGSASISNQKGISNGLTFRPLAESMKDTYDWWHSDSVDQAMRDEFELDQKSVFFKEQSIIEEWKAR